VTDIMKEDVAISLASQNPPSAEAARSGETVRDSHAGGNSPDQSIGMVRERTEGFPLLPPVQPFPLASKDPSRFDEVPTREPRVILGEIHPMKTSRWLALRHQQRRSHRLAGKYSAVLPVFSS
jgi:hypothetical protein